MGRSRMVAGFASGHTHSRAGRSLLAMVIALATAGPLSAQQRGTSPEMLAYATFGAGVGNLGFAGQAGFAVRVPRVGEFTVRTAGVRPFDIFGTGEPNGNDVALLYGVRHTDDKNWVSAGIGPAMAWTTARRCNDARGGLLCSSWEVTGRDTHPGVGVQALIGWRGISLGLLGDVNAARSFGAATFDIHIGKVW